jgi:hypothetical protein
MSKGKASFFLKFKPAVNKKILLYIAGTVWTFAGGFLLYRSLNYLIHSPHLLVLELSLASVGGLAFYSLLFKKISSNHITRMKGITTEKPCAFSFFNIRSYVLMSVMIIMGITLRRLGIVDPHVLYTFMVAMGIPLLMSAAKFFANGRNYSLGKQTIVPKPNIDGK